MDIKNEIAEATALLRGMPTVADYALVGSALYMPAANDVDFAVMLADGQRAMPYAARLAGEGWETCGEYDTDAGTWCAVRRGSLNLMLTHDRQFFDGYRLAMAVCQALRLESREERIAVCRVVRDRVDPEQARFEAGLLTVETEAELPF